MYDNLGLMAGRFIFDDSVGGEREADGREVVMNPPEATTVERPRASARGS
jgi:hypothetical protein